MRYSEPVPRKKDSIPASVREAMRWLSKRGAAKGGKARWKGVSAEERSAHAKRAVAAREAKRAKGTR
jgi:hypothetical protein